MCGRFSRYKTWKEIWLQHQPLDGSVPNEELRPRSDIRPTTKIPIIRRRDSTNEGVSLRWGLIPAKWASAKPKYVNHNARFDRLLDMEWWSEPLAKKQTCLIPASGYYEWMVEELPPSKPGGKPKQIKHRYYFTPKQGDMLTFAGLWDRNDKIGPDTVESCTMITVEPNDYVAQFHDRMPAILPREHFAAWLKEPSLDLLRPAPVEFLEAVPVRNDIRDEDSLESLRTIALT